MTKILIYDRRFSKASSKREKIVVKFAAQDIVPDSGEIPKHIREYWEKNRSILGYADFRRMNIADCKRVYALAKGRKDITFGVSRMGGVSGFRIKEGNKQFYTQR